MDAYCLERNDFRLFKLSRMSGLTALDTVFSRRQYQPKAIVQPDFQDENIVCVTLRVRGNAVERLEDVFGPEAFGEIDGEWVTARIPISNDKRGYQFLLGFGADCICVEPQSVCGSMLRYLKEIVKLYSDIAE